MNSELLKLYEKYEVPIKDRHEISQIFNFLSEDKKQNILKHFELLYSKIHTIQQELQVEHEILVGNVISDIEIAIQKAKKELT